MTLEQPEYADFARHWRAMPLARVVLACLRCYFATVCFELFIRLITPHAGPGTKRGIDAMAVIFEVESNFAMRVLKESNR